MEIKQAKTRADIEEIGRLFREYERLLNVDLCFQHFEEELASLPGKYASPDGELLIATQDDEYVGCVAVRKLDEGVCEMKRLYVRPSARGAGIGRKLSLEIIAIAKKLGYTLMRLDTLERLTEAMHLYESLGFTRTGAYYDNPLPGVVYLELELNN